MQKTGFEKILEFLKRFTPSITRRIYSNTGYEKRNDRKLIING